MALTIGTCHHQYSGLRVIDISEGLVLDAGLQSFADSGGWKLRREHRVGAKRLPCESPRYGEHLRALLYAYEVAPMSQTWYGRSLSPS